MRLYGDISPMISLSARQDSRGLTIRPPQKRPEMLQRAAIAAEPVSEMAPPIVGDVLHSLGQPLDAATRSFMEPRFGHDFSNVRVHADDKAAASARRVHALAYTVGNHVAFNTGQYRPDSRDGRRLLAHELAHVVQQGDSMASATSVSPAEGTQEDIAERAASEVIHGTVPRSEQSATATGIQRRVQFRDVGRGEQSGFARLPELIARLNAVSSGLTYSVVGNELAYESREEGELSEFDRQMTEFVDQAAVIPLRLTNRHGLLQDPAGRYTERVEADTWGSGYVDIDDVLASSELGMQLLLVHLIAERAATPNYARRIGSASLDTNQPAPLAEFNRRHRTGIDAEVRLLRAFFGDPTIRFVTEFQTGAIFRVHRNSRGDVFRARITANRGVDAVSVEVRTPDGRILTPEEYLEILNAERIRDQVARERLSGATEHRAGAGSVPAP